MKHFQTLWIVTRKFYRKFYFSSFDWSRVLFDRSIECFFRSIDRMFFWSIEQESNSNWIIQSPQDYFLHHFDWSSKSFNRWKSLFSNFTQKISELEFSLYETIFSKLKHHYYNLTMYIPIYTTNSLFLYNSIIVTHITAFPIILFLFQINKENLYFICSYAFPYSIIQNNCFSIIHFLK